MGCPCCHNPDLTVMTLAPVEDDLGRWEKQIVLCPVCCAQSERVVLSVEIAPGAESITVWAERPL